MAKLKKTAEQCTSVKISLPSTIEHLVPLYSKLYHFYDVSDAFWFVANKVNQGYRVQLDFPGDPEICFDPSLVNREGV